jgi:hypothetical protein
MRRRLILDQASITFGRVLVFLEAAIGIEPMNKGFAVHRVFQ